MQVKLFFQNPTINLKAIKQVNDFGAFRGMHEANWPRWLSWRIKLFNVN